MLGTETKYRAKKYPETITTRHAEKIGYVTKKNMKQPRAVFKLKPPQSKRIDKYSMRQHHSAVISLP